MKAPESNPSPKPQREASADPSAHSNESEEPPKAPSDLPQPLINPQKQGKRAEGQAQIRDQELEDDQDDNQDRGPAPESGDDLSQGKDNDKDKDKDKAQDKAKAKPKGKDKDKGKGKTSGGAQARPKVLAEEDSKEMNLDEEEGESPKPEIHTSNKPQRSFLQGASHGGQLTKKDRLRSLFVRYAEVSDETGLPGMRSRHFLTCLQDAGLLDGGRLIRSKADIIYSAQSKGKKGSMSFEGFLACLVKVAEIVYPALARERKSKALELLISERLLPLQETLAGASVEGSVSGAGTSRRRTAADLAALTTGLQYDADVKVLLYSVIGVLKDVYDIYFLNAFKAAKTQTQVIQASSKQLVAFLRDFDLTKNFVQRQTVLVMLDTLVNLPNERLTNCPDTPAVFGDVEEDYGTYFTLARFFVLLCWIAVIGFDATKAEPEEHTAVGTQAFVCKS